MKSIIFSVPDNLAEAQNKKFVPVFSTESFVISSQKIDGAHPFGHVNEKHDEVIYVVKGRMSMRVGEERCELKAGDLLKIPRNLSHGDIEGHNAEILVFEGQE